MNTTYKENIHFRRLGIRTVAQLICELVVLFNVFSLTLRSSWLQIFLLLFVFMFLLFHSSVYQLRK